MMSNRYASDPSSSTSNSRQEDDRTRTSISSSKRAEVEEKKSESPEGGLFECANCGLKEKYHYFGRKPPFAKAYTFLEDVYVARDPFTPPAERISFLFLGAECVGCHRLVCQSGKCSLFYSKRFCLKCAYENIEEFPDEMKQEILKRC